MSNEKRVLVHNDDGDYVIECPLPEDADHHVVQHIVIPEELVEDFLEELASEAGMTLIEAAEADPETTEADPGVRDADDCSKFRR